MQPTWHSDHQAKDHESHQTSHDGHVTHLSSRAKAVSKVNSNDPATLQVHHEVGQVPVPYPQHVLTHGEGGQGAQEVGAQHQEGLGGGGETEEGAAQKVPRHTRDFLPILSLHLGGGCFPVVKEDGSCTQGMQTAHFPSTVDFLKVVEEGMANAIFLQLEARAFQTRLETRSIMINHSSSELWGFTSTQQQ